MSRLEESSKQYRDNLISKNTYKEGDQYNVSHENALSDGDDKGKGETNTVGSKTDIDTRNTLMTKNMYNQNNEYNDSNA